MRLSLALAAAATMVGLAVPALADPPPPSVPDNPAADATFLDSLNKAGMTYTNNSSAIAAGKMACDLMNSGTSEKDVVDKLSMLNPGLNSGGAMKFAALASSAYCPDYLNKSSTPTKSASPFPGFGGR
ncbi:MAG TPA: DUF732 domain-containing protein [Mycobacterium sp.]|nr:DUF732 domain-containing protein [Mycobacterium sp.]